MMWIRELLGHHGPRDGSRTKARAVIEAGFAQIGEQDTAKFSEMLRHIPEERISVQKMRKINHQRLTSQRDIAILHLKQYKSETICSINDMVSSGDLNETQVFNILVSHGRDETAVRESLTYLNTIGPNCSPAILREVRKSLRCKDTSKYHDRAAATTVYRVSMALSHARIKKAAAPNTVSIHPTHDDSQKTMTRKLADLIVQHHDRTEDILDYLSLRCETKVGDNEVQSLEEYLNNPARSLSEGAL